jgi:hypothetical protein
LQFFAPVVVLCRFCVGIWMGCGGLGIHGG